MHMTHDRCPDGDAPRHKRAANRAEKIASTLGSFVMLLTFIISLVSSKPAYVWKPAVTLTDPRIVSELAGSAN